MFVSEKLAYIELHKTGSTHICKLLAETVGGTQMGKHNNPSMDHRGRVVLGSVRDPWDWYVSLWAYGCAQEGSVYDQTCDSVNFRHYWSDLPREMMLRFTSPATFLRSWANDRRKSRQDWLDCYRDSQDPLLFRTWLHRIMDPDRALDVREGFGFCPLSQHSGLLTYRYIKLYTTLRSKLFGNRTLDSFAGMQAAFERYQLVDHIIRNEHLEDDLIAALHASGHEIDVATAERIRANRHKKTNRSERKGTAHYYDESSAALVAEREKLIIQRHGYTSPV